MAGRHGIAIFDIDWGRAPLRDLTAHIIAEHHGRFRVELPSLQELLKEVYALYRSQPSRAGRRTIEPRRVRMEIHTGTPSAPAADWNTAPLRDLIRHIVTTHHEYLKLELPRVGQRLRTVVQVHGANDPKTLQELETVYEMLWQELNLYMHKDEMMLFPVIERFEAAVQSGTLVPPPPFGSIRTPIAVMEREHDSAGGGLGRIRDLTRGFEAPSYACTTYCAMLEGLHALETDLHAHIHLENNVLFPRAIALEERALRNN